MRPHPGGCGLYSFFGKDFLFGSLMWMRVDCVESGGTSVEVPPSWFRAGHSEPIGLNSAEVEGEAGDASEDASGCGLTTTYPGGREGRCQFIRYLFPLCQSAWREVPGR
jgi:hypothetical protein